MKYKIDIDIFDTFTKNDIVLPYPTYNTIKAN
jgi:hypothetical protein